MVVKCCCLLVLLDRVCLGYAVLCRMGLSGSLVGGSAVHYKLKERDGPTRGSPERRWSCPDEKRRDAGPERVSGQHLHVDGRVQIPSYGLVRPWRLGMFVQSRCYCERSMEAVHPKNAR